MDEFASLCVFYFGKVSVGPDKAATGLFGFGIKFEFGFWV